VRSFVWAKLEVWAMAMGVPFAGKVTAYFIRIDKRRIVFPDMNGLGRLREECAGAGPSG